MEKIMKGNSPMKKIITLLSLLAMTAPAAVEIKEQNGNVSMNNGTLSARLVKGRNYAFNLTGRDRNGKSLGLVIQSMIWYHGRTGNTEHFYQDQSELKWKPQKYEIKGNMVRVFTGNTDYDVTREMEMFDDIGAVRLEYIITSRESRDFSRDKFPMIYLAKEIQSVSFDNGNLKDFRTKPAPGGEDLVNTRALLLHMPEYDKTLLMLIDINTPLKYGHKLGLMPTYRKTGWCKIVSFNQLWQGSLPYYDKGMKLGAGIYFQLLDGGSLTEQQKTAARQLAERFQLAPAQFSGSLPAPEYRAPSGLAGKLGGIPGVGLWHESPMKRVYPGTESPDRTVSAVKLESAANERESFQLVLNPESPAVLEKVILPELTSSGKHKIPAKNLQACALEYQIVESPLALLYGERKFADKLLPLPERLPLKLTAKENNILHLTVYTPAGTPPGLYAGNVTLRINGKECKVPVSLKVWGFELPKRSAYCAHGLLWNSPQKDREEVLKYLTACGMNGTVYYGGQRELRKYFDGKELHMPDDFSLAEKAIKEYGMPMFQAPWLFLGAWDWKPGKKVHFLNLDVNSGEFEEKFANYLKSFHRQAKEKGILQNSFAYLWDEMTGGHYETMRRTVGMVRKYAPGLRLMTVAAPDPEVLANNDIICVGPLSHWWSRDAQKIVRDSRKNGKEFWIYMNGVTFGTDTEAIVPRLTPWMCHSRGISGFLQWSMDYNWKYGTFAKNGHVWLLYPSADKPVYSVRLEYFRDGVEDFNMMKLMEKLPPEIRTRLEKEIESIAPAFGKTSLDPVRLAEVRRRIGETLDKNLK